MPLVDLAAWNDFLARHPNAHLLQTAAWGELKASFGWEALRLVVGDCGAQVLFRRLPLGFTLAYLPKGPVGEECAALWPELDAICRRRRAVFLKVEPDDSAQAADLPPNFRPSPHSVQPPRTLLVDLRGSEDELLARMKQKTRYNIRLAERKGVLISPSNDIEAFSSMMEITGERDGFGVHFPAYYRRAYELFHPLGACELFLAEYEGESLAALMVFAHGPRAWYLYGASTDRHRNLMPTYLLQWEAMRWARAQGCTSYDLYGVPDEDEVALESHFTHRADGLWGVYRFKRGFGGILHRAAPTQDKVYVPALYFLYRWFFARRLT